MKVMMTTYRVVTQSRPKTFLNDQTEVLLSKTLMYTYSNVGREYICTSQSCFSSMHRRALKVHHVTSAKTRHLAWSCTAVRQGCSLRALQQDDMGNPGMSHDTITSDAATNVQAKHASTAAEPGNAQAGYHAVMHNSPSFGSKQSLPIQKPPAGPRMARSWPDESCST